MSLDINPKELVEKLLKRHEYELSLSKKQKIENLFNDMKFEIKMYEKHDKHKGNRFDKKHLNFNLWTLISRIEHIKNTKE